jgi:predicted house-cleaning NTP pyrophosphatase (Maf/HAM1 superfamily)
MSAAPMLILASASPRRRELLSQLGVGFTVVTAAVTEHEDPATDPRIMVAHNAALKADWVAARHPEALVLGADTTVFLEGAALNKPADAVEARGNRLGTPEPTAAYLLQPVQQLWILGVDTQADDVDGFVFPGD